VADGTLLPSAPARPPATSLNTRALISRIQHVAAKLRVQLELEHDTDETVDEEQAAEFSVLFNDIGVTLAGGNAQAVKPLLALFDECGPSSFLDASLVFISLDCTGLLLAWAFEYAQEEPHILLRLLQQQTHKQSSAEEKRQQDEQEDGEVELSLSGLVEYVNRQAAFYECFPGHQRVARMHIPVV